MAVATASEKAHMARCIGVNYDVMSDQYVFPDGTRIAATSVAKGQLQQQYYSNNTGVTQQAQQLHQMQQQIHQQQQQYYSNNTKTNG